jgi:hypothetical protein
VCTDNQRFGVTITIFTVLALLFIRIASSVVFFYPFGSILGQQEPFINSSVSITLKPIYSPDHTIMKTFQKEFGEMLKKSNSMTGD